MTNDEIQMRLTALQLALQPGGYDYETPSVLDRAARYYDFLTGRTPIAAVRTKPVKAKRPVSRK